MSDDIYTLEGSLAAARAVAAAAVNVIPMAGSVSLDRVNNLANLLAAVDYLLAIAIENAEKVEVELKRAA